MTENSVPIRSCGQALLKGRIVINTGLHIGAGKDAVEIGGIDNPVVKTPEGDPYIPGSSLKGKLRFLLEWAFNKVSQDGSPWTGGNDGCDPEDPVLRIFGTPAKKEAWSAGPTRLLMRDAMLNKNWRAKVLEAGRELTESKTEVLIDRVAGKAGKAGPRQTERVPPGAAFEFEARFRLYDVDGDGGKRDRECLAWLLQGLGLLEQDALGGSGSRGYGRISFENLTLTGPAGKDVRIDDNETPLQALRFSPEQPDPAILAKVEQALN